MTWRARKTLSLKQLRRELRNEHDVDAEVAAAVADEMPRTRAECPTSRPCPWLGCRHHIALDVTDAGSIVVPLAGWEEHDTCALDVAERKEPLTLEEVGELLGITRERVRQIEQRARDKIAAAIGGGP